ncbi:mitochondrial inner membrane protease subunit 2 [Geosmithia morbida]|uniref:Mitochondrial inner membrane protease subunit 2 n=1 Tax=Geosmithia morbida TaxID=1094350 RepID=A0A9P5D4W5_9HYPO|nr:mitochondrial inner membrane protease subunit 2 [Geosmithia morbida]KAF4126542.1 mitochondrial inner membrane protease subunit 2 [Geosmithia morbida]
MAAASRASIARAVAWNLAGLATWVPVIAWFNLHVAELTTVNGPSMYPLFNAEKDSTLTRDVALNWKWKAQDDLERGMVVALRSPVHPEVVSVKRIIAMEGELVQTRAPFPTATIQVPEGHVWVEGDGPLGSSLDSNTYGPVSKRLITGKITHMVFPFRKFGAIDWRERAIRPPR